MYYDVTVALHSQPFNPSADPCTNAIMGSTTSGAGSVPHIHLYSPSVQAISYEAN